MADRTYVFRLVGDFGSMQSGAEGAARAADHLGDATDGVARRHAAAAVAGDKSTRSLGGVAASSKLTRQEVLALNYTLSDVAASLASGASPFTILLQQGGQVKDTFGGIGPLFSKLGSLITPTRVAVGLLGTTFVAFSAAAVLGYQENAKFERSLLLTGNRAGTTASEMDALTDSISRSTNTTARSTREALQAVVSTGQFGPEVLAQAATAVQLISKRTGQSADEIVKDLSRMTGGVAKYAAEQNKSLNLITAAQYKYLQSLEAQGRSQEAQLEYLRILSERMGKQLPSDLGYLERAWNGVKSAASAAWDAMLSIGKPDSVAQQLENVRAQLEQEQERLAFARSGRGGKAEIAAREAAVAALNVRVETLREGQRAEERAAENAAASAGRNAKEIEALQQARVEAGLAVERSGFARQQALAEVARARESAELEQQYLRQEISQQRYIERRYALEKGSIDAQAALVQQEIALEQRRSVGSPEEAAQQQSRLLDLQARRIGLERQYIALRAQRDNGQLAGDPRDLAESAQAAFRRLELEQGQATASAFRERGVAAKQAAAELLQGNRALSVALIRDDRERGLAQIALEEEALRKRLDLGALEGEERKAAEDEIARYVLMRNEQLADELRPAWQRMLEGWRDMNRLMRETSDQFQTDFLRTSEDTFVEFFKSGKVNIERLGDLLLESALRFQFQSQIGQYAGQLGGVLASFLGFGGGTPQAGTITGGSGLTVPAPRKLATGTDRVPYDGFIAQLHKDEKVVPAKYRDSDAANGNVYITVENRNGSQIQTTQTQSGGDRFIKMVVDQAASEVDRRIASGGSTARALQSTFSLQRATPRRS